MVPSSVFRLPHQGLNKHAEPGKRPEEAQRSVLSPFLSFLVDARRIDSPGEAYCKLINEKIACLLGHDVTWTTKS